MAHPRSRWKILLLMESNLLIPASPFPYFLILAFVVLAIVFLVAVVIVVMTISG